MITEMEKVIFDTNTLKCDNSSQYFLGGRSELEKFGKISKIIIPDLVIEEIKCQKWRNLSSKRKSFFDNIFHKILSVNETDTKNFDIGAFIKEQEDNENISYEVIKLTDFSILSSIRELALWNKAPFSKKSDKGFKDTYIFFTVLEFLKSNPEENVYFVTKDERLKEAFALQKKVIVVSDFDDFQRYRLSYFREPYFVEKLCEEVSKDISSEYIRDAWLNLNSN